MINQRYVVTGMLLIACGMVAAGQPRGGNGFEGVELTAVHVAGNVHMVTRPGGGGNVGVFSGPEGVLLVDSLFAPLADRLVTTVREISIEQLAPILSENPKGLVLARDELAAWAGGFDKYRGGKGEESAHWLEMYRAGKLTVDRKTGDPKDTNKWWAYEVDSFKELARIKKEDWINIR